LGVAEGVGTGVGAGVGDGSEDENHVLRMGAEGGDCFAWNTGARTSFGAGVGGGPKGVSVVGGLPFEFSSNVQLPLKDTGLGETRDRSVLPDPLKSAETSSPPTNTADDSEPKLLDGEDSAELLALALPPGVWGRGPDLFLFALGSKPCRNGSTSPPTSGEIRETFFDAPANLAGLGAMASFPVEP